MRLEGWNWSLPAVAMVLGVGIGLLLIFTRGFWKALPGWIKFLTYLVIVVLFVLLLLGRLPLPL